MQILGVGLSHLLFGCMLGDEVHKVVVSPVLF